jgi:hypothetical protein
VERRTSGVGYMCDRQKLINLRGKVPSPFCPAMKSRDPAAEKIRFVDISDETSYRVAKVAPDKYAASSFATLLNSTKCENRGTVK